MCPQFWPGKDWLTHSYARRTGQDWLNHISDRGPAKIGWPEETLASVLAHELCLWVGKFSCISKSTSLTRIALLKRRVAHRISPWVFIILKGRRSNSTYCNPTVDLKDRISTLPTDILHFSNPTLIPKFSCNLWVTKKPSSYTRVTSDTPKLKQLPDEDTSPH